MGKQTKSDLGETIELLELENRQTKTKLTPRILTHTPMTRYTESPPTHTFLLYIHGIFGPKFDREFPYEKLSPEFQNGGKLESKLPPRENFTCVR